MKRVFVISIYYLNTTRKLGILAALLLMFHSDFSTAQAFCSLRDPKHGIHELYPHATNYRSMVRVVGEKTQTIVEQRLPPQTLHFNELGRHTLYVALAEGKPLGLVHVRSEESQWGLVEIAWAIDFNLRIVDFRFQRCRHASKKLLEKDDFRAQLVGKNFTELLALLQPGTNHLLPGVLDIPPGAEQLVEVLIRCGLKTTLVTELAWKDEIRQLRLMKQAEEAFGSSVADVFVIAQPLTQAITERLDASLDGALLGTKRKSVSVTRVLGKNKQLLGSLYHSVTTLEGRVTRLVWAIDSDNTIRQIDNLGGWRNSRDQKVFEMLIGKRFTDIKQCGNRAQMLGLEATLITDHSVTIEDELSVLLESHSDE